MPIEFSCQNCNKTLRVPSEFAGRKARCPNCQNVNIIIGSSSDIEATDTENKNTSAASTPQIRFQNTNPGLGDLPNAAEPDQSTNPFDTLPHQSEHNPYSTPVQPNYNQPRRPAGQTPHRGGLVLTLGILSVFCNFCLIPGTLSLVFGLADLKKIDRGEMDREGHGLTLAGTILGGIMMSIHLLLVMFYVFIFFIAAIS